MGGGGGGGVYICVGLKVRVTIVNTLFISKTLRINTCLALVIDIKNRLNCLDIYKKLYNCDTNVLQSHKV